MNDAETTLSGIVFRIVVMIQGLTGRLVAWHLSGKSVGPACRWAATSNAKEGRTTFSVNRGRVGTEGGEGSEGQGHR